MQSLIVILGVPIDSLTMVETVDRIEALILDGRARGCGHQAATVNADFLINAHSDRSQLSILQNASVALPDGMPVVWAARMLGAPMPERVTGADVVFELAQRSADRGFSMYFLGAAPEVAQRAAVNLQKRYPGLKVAGVQSPNLRSIEDTDASILEAIRAAHPDILLVAFGNPKQEKWIARFGPELAVPVMIGVGGTFDFIAGNKKRAPLWMQKSGLEWVYRLGQEPGRLWRRYGRDIWVFGKLFLRQWLHMHPRRLPPGQVSEATSANGQAHLAVRGALCAEDLPAFYRRVEQAIRLSSNVCIDLSQATFLDAAALGALVSLHRAVRQLGGDLLLTSIPPQLQKTLKLLELDTVFSPTPPQSAFTAEPA